MCKIGKVVRELFATLREVHSRPDFLVNTIFSVQAGLSARYLAAETNPSPWNTRENADDEISR